MMLLQNILVVATILTGLISLIRPRSVMDFTGLVVSSARGITEIRSILGGTFIGLGIAPLILDVQAAYQMLGITYLAIAVARVAGLVFDRSFQPSNWISLVFEIAAGIVLML